LDILVFNRKISKSSKYLSKMEKSFKNWNFEQKSKYWSRIKILFKNCNFVEKRNIDHLWSYPNSTKMNICIQRRNYPICNIWYVI